MAYVQTSESVPMRLWLAAGALFLAMFINLLDVTIVNLALPAIQSDLGATSTQLEWVLVIYILTFAAGLLPFGRFGDVYGRDRMFLIGIAGFILCSVISGLAPDIQTLILGRAAKGLFGAMMVPQVLAIVHVLFTGEEKGKAIGAFAMVNAMGAIIGPILGGFILQADIAGLGWRPIFLINVPLGILSIIGVLKFVPHLQRDPSRHTDWVGATLFAAMIVLVTFPLVEGRALGWPIWLIALFALAVLSGTAFLRLQHKRAALGLEQLLPVSLLSDVKFGFGLGFVMLFFSGIAGVMALLAILLQTGFGLAPLAAGFALAPHPIGVMIASLATGRLGTRWLQERITLGTFGLAIGMVFLQRVVDAGDTGSQYGLWAAFLVVGLGMGTAVTVLFQQVLSRVDPKDAGAGSGALQALQQFGIAMGVALVLQLFFQSLGQSAAPQDYGKAASQALWYPIGIYSLLAIWGLAALVRKPRVAA